MYFWFIWKNEEKESIEMKQLTEAMEKLHITWNQEMLHQFEGYMDGILEWNEKINLTAIKNREEFVEKHMIDSILCHDFPEYEKSSHVIDVGTGAGFPGIPLAIVTPIRISCWLIL